MGTCGRHVGTCITLALSSGCKHKITSHFLTYLPTPLTARTRVSSTFIILEKNGKNILTLLENARHCLKIESFAQNRDINYYFPYELPIG